MSKQLLTTREAANYLGLKENTLEIWRCVGRYNLPYARVGGRAIRYRISDLDAFIQRGMVNVVDGKEE
jgi:excisionase family DNA binding protein